LKPGYELDRDNDENEADDNDIEQAIVLQKTIGAITDACGEYIYTDIFGVERTAFRNRVYEILGPSLAQSYIILDDFIMGEINSTKDIEASLSTKSTAQQQSQAALFQAEQARTVAKGEADAAILSAEGEADSAVLRAKGQAIQMLSDELEKHGISLIDWNWLETWNGNLPATLVISDDIGSPLMTIDIAPTPDVPVQNVEVPVPTPEQ
jgi:regulator of protease activity HflC (stomatin/prohibitin superfamily)